jgi:hypothetical protein
MPLEKYLFEFVLLAPGPILPTSFPARGPVNMPHIAADKKNRAM